MSQSGTIKRYSLLIKKVTEHPFPSMKEIMDYLAQKGFENSSRTVQRDMESLDFEFGLKIAYNKAKKGYYIAEKDYLLYDPFIRLLRISETIDVLIQSFADSKEMLKYVSLDIGAELKGIDQLHEILNALRNNQTLTFNYQTFFEGPKKPFTVHPYLIKEFQHRWYLVACFPGFTKLYIFGIDRISDPVVNSTAFVPDPNLDARQKFRDAIGVSCASNAKERIVLSFTPQQGNYVKSLPLHNSQQILVDDDKELRVVLNVAPNYELSQQILMHGSTVKVIEPVWLVKEIRDTLEEALEQYRQDS